MSYGLAIAGDARADLKNIDIWLLEEVWDELERIASDPSLLVPAPAGNGQSYEFIRVSGGTTFRVVISVVRNDTSRLLTVLGITAEQLPLPPMG